MTGFSMAQRPAHHGHPLVAAVVWRTCVREIAFVDAAGDLPAAAEIWHDEEAYARLLEVVCGLDSPIVGETEVLHQFKVFADSLAADDREWRELCRSVLADARAIRARHLVGLGSRSYGSAVRRYLRSCAHVAVVGTGVLAREILPFVADDGRTVDLWGRRATCPIPNAPAAYRRLDATLADSPHRECALVVAAPIASSGIAAVAANYRNVEVIVDLRSEGAHDQSPAIAPVVTLADIFAEFDRAAAMTSTRVAAARHDISRSARAFVTRAKLNPSGWHDLCA
jgi:glutamyl-tRNA reductase